MATVAIVDGIVRDGLQDPYDGSMMGVCGDLCAEEQGLDRTAGAVMPLHPTKRLKRHRIMDGSIRKMLLLKFHKEKVTRLWCRVMRILIKFVLKKYQRLTPCF